MLQNSRRLIAYERTGDILIAALLCRVRQPDDQGFSRES